MKKHHKLELKDLKVQSFITALDPNKSRTVGGGPPIETVFSANTNCTECWVSELGTACTCPSVGIPCTHPCVSVVAD